MSLPEHILKEKLSIKMARQLLSEQNASINVDKETFEFYLGYDPEEPIFFLDAYNSKGHVGYIDFYMFGGGAKCDIYKKFNKKQYISDRRAFGIHVFPEHALQYKGIGTTLVALATRIAKEKGAKHFDFAGVIGAEGEDIFYKRIGGMKGITQRDFLNILEKVHPHLVQSGQEPEVIQYLVTTQLPEQAPWRFLLSKRAEEDGYFLPHIGIEKRVREVRKPRPSEIKRPIHY